MKAAVACNVSLLIMALLPLLQLQPYHSPAAQAQGPSRRAHCVCGHGKLGLPGGGLYLEHRGTCTGNRLVSEPSARAHCVCPKQGGVPTRPLKC